MNFSKRAVKRGVLEVENVNAILAQNKAMAQKLSVFNKKLKKLEVAAVGTHLAPHPSKSWRTPAVSPKVVNTVHEGEPPEVNSGCSLIPEQCDQQQHHNINPGMPDDQLLAGIIRECIECGGEP
ncbi:hypothetical protein PIB30_095184 [Stylosanthes scabra]|uniref:Uncharacterized protein n=1 Tax=Stylosanthes scabra TaxID=79078 RepID=A0ABU6ZUI0_9FABA|nr:hypothetical protein [Stylosanthes scabra]